MAVESGAKISIWQPNQMFPQPSIETTAFLEGPHYPEPHRWYASVKLDEYGFIKKGSVK